MNRKLLALAGAAWLLGTSASFAQDSTAPFDWTGFYIGVFGGAAFGEIDGGSSGTVCMGECPEEPEPIEYGDFNLEDENFLGGMQAGYNVQVGNFVLGLFAELMKTQIEGSEDFEFYDPSLEGEYYGEASADLKHLATLQAKFGYVYGSLLFFAMGGAAWGEIDAEVGYSYEYVNGNEYEIGAFAAREGGGCYFDYCDHDSDTTFGYTLGFGMAAKLSQHMFAELGYSYVNLGDADFDFDFDESLVGSAEADFSAHLIKFGLNWQF